MVAVDQIVEAEGSLASLPRPAPWGPAPWRLVPWFVFILVMVCQSALDRGGTIAAAVYLGSMLLFVAAHPRNAEQAAIADLVPWLYPALALASILWSDAASTSLRLAIELCFTTAVMLALGRRLSTRDLISGLMVALFLCALLSFAIGGRASLISSGLPLIGMYGSKNLLAFHMVLLVLSSAAVMLDGTQPAPVRLIAVPAFVLGLFMIRAAQSTGASVMGAVALMVLLGVVFISMMPGRLHVRLVASVVIMALAVGVLVLSVGHEIAEAFFTATGKDAGLTGRTFLWQRAAQLIAERPTLGYGYQAFWRQDYPEAEALWRYFKIATRTGFHFHDLYYEVTIELGLVGLATIVFTLGAYGFRTLRHALRKPGPQTGLLLAVCVLLLARSGIEVDFCYPFGTVSALFPILLTRFIVGRRQAVPAWHFGGTGAGTARWSPRGMDSMPSGSIR
jgi:exopolysaccharide production protein ExoQ